MSKAARTRELLADTALRLFQERGYSATTMRLVADEAGVSLGNAYYYFSGKDDFVHELYVRIQSEHRTLAAPQLISGAPLATNLRTVLHTGIDVMTPYHSFGATMLGTALASDSGVSPFSAQSAAPREAATALMKDALLLSRGAPRGELGDRLPLLLWLGYLAVTLHWVRDTSPNQHRTRELIDGFAPIVALAVGLARLPVARSLTTDIIRLTDRLTRNAL